MMPSTISRVARTGPLWQAMPDTVRDGFSATLPQKPQPLEQTYAEITENLMPYGWATSIRGSGCGTWVRATSPVRWPIFWPPSTARTLVAATRRQVWWTIKSTGWIRDMMGFPPGPAARWSTAGRWPTSSGLTAARNAMAGVDLREDGRRAMPQPLRFYASDQVHNCHHKAMNLLGWQAAPVPGALG